MNVFTTRQILKHNLYNASDFEFKILRRVRFKKKNIFLKGMILKKKFV